MDSEVWKDITGYEGWYQVSNLGNVRSLDRTVSYVTMTGKTAVQHYRGRPVKQTLARSDGMYRVMLSKNSTHKFRSVHRLVAEAFVPREAGQKYVIHKDGNTHNNVADNLKWLEYTPGQAKRVTSVDGSEIYYSIKEAANALNTTEHKLLKAILNETPVGGKQYKLVRPVSDGCSEDS